MKETQSDIWKLSGKNSGASLSCNIPFPAKQVWAVGWDNYTVSTNLTRWLLQLHTLLRHDGRPCQWSCVLLAFLDTAALERRRWSEQLLKHFCSKDSPELPKGKSFHITLNQYCVYSLQNKERDLARIGQGAQAIWQLWLWAVKC